MRRQVLLMMTCVLSLVTGAALLVASTLVAAPAGGTGPMSAPGDGDPANPALVNRFYEAFNATLGTGDPAPLVSLIAADFADRAARPGVAPTRAGLVQHVLALRDAFPAMWLAVEDVQAHGDWVLARVRVGGLARGVVLGMPSAGMPASWEGIDVFRVAGGRIAERWAGGDWPVLAQPLARAALARPPAGAFVRLGRLTFAPGASQPRSAALGPLLVVVERGGLTAKVEGEAVLTRAATVDTGATAEPGAPPAADVPLGAGDALVLSGGARYALRNPGREPAVVLVLALLPWSAGAPEGGAFLWPEAELPDVGAQRLIEDVATDLPTGPAALVLGRVTLAPRAELAATGGTGSWLAVVEAGALEIGTSAGPGTTLAAGQATVVQTMPVPTFRNAGDRPLILLLVAVTPTEEGIVPPPTPT